MQFHAPKETFSLVHWTQLSGKLSRLKSEHVRKNDHASQLNANGSNPLDSKDFYVSSNTTLNNQGGILFFTALSPLVVI